MKILKFTALIAIIVLFVMTSCTNEDAIIEDQQTTEESASIVLSMASLKSQLNANGNFSTESNQTGNIVFDFCFDFVYPINLSYNNGTSVAVNDLEELIQVLINSNESLFINGIAFPFDIETFNASSNTIEIVTINNETEFETLIQNCEFYDDTDDCVCLAIYEPVCVEVTDPYGGTFVLSYPNECWAICDGFTENDFLDECEDDDYYDEDFFCFDFNYPLDIVLDDGSVVTVTNDEDFENAVYGSYFYNFVYPFSVTLDEDDTVVVINNIDDFEVVIEDCYGDYQGECSQCENLPYDPVCVQFVTATGEVYIEEFPNLCYVECMGLIDDIVDCGDDDDDDDDIETGCTEDNVLSILADCNQWSVVIGNAEYIYTFNMTDNSISVTDGNGTVITTGTWSIMEDQIYNLSVLEIITQSQNFTDWWMFTDCDDNDPDVISELQYVVDSECE